MYTCLSTLCALTAEKTTTCFAFCSELIVFLFNCWQRYIASETLRVFAPLAKLLGMYKIKVMQVSWHFHLQLSNCYEIPSVVRPISSWAIVMGSEVLWGRSPVYYPCNVPLGCLWSDVVVFLLLASWIFSYMSSFLFWPLNFKFLVANQGFWEKLFVVSGRTWKSVVLWYCRNSAFKKMCGILRECKHFAAVTSN